MKITYIRIEDFGRIAHCTFKDHTHVFCPLVPEAESPRRLYVVQRVALINFVFISTVIFNSPDPETCVESSLDKQD